MKHTASMQATYRLICAQSGIQCLQAVADQITLIGARAFEDSPAVYPDVAGALERLGSRFGLLLLTKGDRQVQQERLRTSGLAGSFDQVLIVENKDLGSYLDAMWLIQARPADCWAVGNSARSDINPALNAGLRCVMVPNRSWAFEAAQLLPGDVRVLETLGRAADYILSHTA